ncbi:MAG: ABC transporter substrate-binding protein [Bacteroidetes bacterium]|nr:ABC transporter substrate-binding protein [Bacteroidota bacterium]
MVRNLIALSILILFPIFLYSQENDTSKVNNEFKQGLDFYNSSNFKDAHQIFNHIIMQNRLNPKTTIVYIFDGKSLLQLKLFYEAKDILKQFLKEYPDSKYVDEAKLTLAQIYVESKDYYSAVMELTALIDTASSTFYNNYAKTSAEKIALNYLSTIQIKSIADSSNGINSKPFLLLLLGKSYLQNDDSADASNSFKSILKDFPNSEEKMEAESLNKKLINGQENISTPVIAALLPLSSSSGNVDMRAVSEILEGIKFAVSTYNKDHDQKLGLIIRDTKRDESEIQKIKNELTKIPSLKAIIGPIYSDEVKETLKAFSNTNIPIISPTATDDDLTGLYPSFFQANPTFQLRGKVMAEYIYYVENKKRMAVLYAEEGYSPTFADSFIKEFKLLGGKIITAQKYNSDSTSFAKQISKIVADSSKLDGIYLPLVDNRDVPAILSQFVLYNFSLPIYGNQDWFLAKGFETYPELSNKLTFDSDYFIDYTDSAYQIFNKGFSNQTKMEADRNVLYGYDAAEYLLTVVKDFNADRKTLDDELEAKIKYQGYHNDIYFDKDRVNKFLNIVRYKDGRFELVDKFKLSK